MTVFGDYSRYYNLLYLDKDYVGEAAYVLGLIRRHAPQASSLLDLGCGTGVHACEFARAGYDTLGLDRSENMLVQAREKQKRRDSGELGRVAFAQGDIRSFELSRTFDAIVALFHVISYLPTDDDLDATFGQIQKHLNPGGILIFDFWYGPAVLTDRPSQRVKVLEDKDVKIVRVATPTLHVNDNLVDVRYDLLVIERSSGHCSEFAENHRMRYLFRPELDALLSRRGLKPIAFHEWRGEKVPDEKSWNSAMIARA
jgi:SAM-dependent methyltransferase